ncbi:peptide ABC transporter substrate-binding protein [Lactococcus sp.]|uniref:peptide ABC transporter substrate-binding protein n=1 Tax=Lactococcus sp. TaxID=44273 RepID=UPI0035B271E5
MKTWKKIGLGTVVLTSATLLAACGSSTATSKVPQLSIPTDIATLDSTLETDTYSNIFVGNTEEGATRVGTNGLPANALATSITESADGLTWTIKLRSGLKWSNGDALTAKDFVYAWQRAVNPATGSQYAYLMGSLKNANKIMAMKSVTQADLDTLGVKADSDTQLTVTLAQPTPYFKFLLAESVYYPLDQKFVTQQGKNYGTSSAKTLYDGPYIYKGSGWTGTNESFALIKNPNYYDKANVKSNEIDIQVIKTQTTAVQLYKQGKLDLVTLGTPDLYNANKDYTKNTKLVSLKEATTNFIEFNQTGKGTTSTTAAKALQNKDIREAINLATDRSSITAQTTSDSTVATGFVPAGMAQTQTGEDFAKYAAQPYTYDTSKAKTLWEKGLKEIGASSVNLSYETDSDSVGAKEQADFLQTSLAKTLPGLTITEKIVPFQQRLKDSANHQFDLVDTLWGGDYAEPSTFLNLFLPGSGQNDGGFSNAEYNTAYTKASTLPDVSNDAARNADYKAAEQALYDQSSIDPIYFRTTPALQSTSLEGLAFHGTGLEYDFKTLYIK